MCTYLNINRQVHSHTNTLTRSKHLHHSYMSALRLMPLSTSSCCWVCVHVLVAVLWCLGYGMTLLCPHVQLKDFSLPVCSVICLCVQFAIQQWMKLQSDIFWHLSEPSVISKLSEQRAKAHGCSYVITTRVYAHWVVSMWLCIEQSISHKAKSHGVPQ